MIPHRKQWASGHTLARCFANPLNAQHKPKVARTRLLELRHAGWPIPECMRDLDKSVPQGTPLPPEAVPLPPRAPAASAAPAKPASAVTPDQLQGLKKDLTALL